MSRLNIASGEETEIEAADHAARNHTA